MLKKILIGIIMQFSFCMVVNDMNEIEEKSKCRSDLLYGVYFSQEVGNQSQIPLLLYDYNSCLKAAKK